MLKCSVLNVKISFQVFVSNDFSLPFQNISEGKKRHFVSLFIQSTKEISLFWPIFSFAMIPLLS